MTFSIFRQHWKNSKYFENSMENGAFAPFSIILSNTWYFNGIKRRYYGVMGWCANQNTDIQQKSTFLTTFFFRGGGGGGGASRLEHVIQSNRFYHWVTQMEYYDTQLIESQGCGYFLQNNAGIIFRLWFWHLLIFLPKISIKLANFRLMGRQIAKHSVI